MSQNYVDVISYCAESCLKEYSLYILCFSMDKKKGIIYFSKNCPSILYNFSETFYNL